MGAAVNSSESGRIGFEGGDAAGVVEVEPVEF
jgi:hypothetical protein